MKTSLVGAIALSIGFILPAGASEPGQPLDCSDWVILAPGLSCEIAIPPSCGDTSNLDGRCVVALDDRAVDNLGNILRIRRVFAGAFCDADWLWRTEIRSSGPTGERVLAQVTDRCVSPEHDYYDAFEALTRAGGWQETEYPQTVNAPIRFDSVGGRALFTVWEHARCNDCGPTPPNYSRTLVFAITGFPTLFEVEQSYTPSTSTLGVRVPLRPEGLHTADHFDTYWGHVESLPDFTQAQPMACNYPGDHQPQAGEYFTVADTSPRPAPGHANYTVTAVSDGTQRRYGRQRIGNVMSGRDPALLPACAAATTAQATPGAVP